MSEDSNSQGEVVVAGVASKPGNAGAGLARRRLIRAGLAAAPVVLSLSGRSAMATGVSCGAKGLSPMAWNSISPGADGNCVTPSRQPGRNTLGRSPGFWKPNTGGSANVFQSPAWPWNKVPVITPFSAYQGGSYSGISSTDARWATGTLFGTVIPTLHPTLVAGTTVQTGKTVATSSISRLLIDNAASPIPIKLACALLNALTFNGYAMTVAEVLFLATNKQLVSGGPVLSDTTIRDFLDQTWS